MIGYFQIHFPVIISWVGFGINVWAAYSSSQVVLHKHVCYGKDLFGLGSMLCVNSCFMRRFLEFWTFHNGTKGVRSLILDWIWLLFLLHNKVPSCCTPPKKKKKLYVKQFKKIIKTKPWLILNLWYIPSSI